MARNSVTDWDTNPDANTDIAGINIGEQCPPGNINNALRTVMAQAAVKFAAISPEVVQGNIDAAINNANTQAAAAKAVVDAQATNIALIGQARTDTYAARDLTQGYASSAVAQGNVPIYASRAAAMGLAIPAGALYLRTNAFALTADNGGALYQRVAADPAAGAAGFRSADRFMPDGSTNAANGGWWVMLPGAFIIAESFGVVADCVISGFTYGNDSGFTGTWTAPAIKTDNTQALLDAMKFSGGIFRTGGSGNGGMTAIRFANTDMTKCYYFGSPVIPPCTVRLEGNCSGADDDSTFGTTFQFPPNTNGLILNHQSTQPSGYAARGAAYSFIDGIRFKGGGGSDRTKHGLWHRMPAFISNCVFDSFSGNNINNVGYTGYPTSDVRFGLTSGSRYDNVTCRNAGNWNTWIEGSDVSASITVNLHHKVSRLGGLYDVGYFANQHLGYENNDHGGGRVGACWRNGRIYAFIGRTPGSGSTTTPGTNDAVWEDQGALANPNVYYPAWDSSKTYEISVPVYLAGATTVTGYMEIYYLPAIGGVGSGGKFFGTWYVGKQTSFTAGSASFPGFDVSTLPIMVRRLAKPSSQIIGSNMETGLGSYPQYNDAAAYYYNVSTEGGRRWMMQFSSAGDWNYGIGGEGSGNPIPYGITGAFTKNLMGGIVPMAQWFTAFRFALGDPTSTANTRPYVMGAAVPTVGVYQRGYTIIDPNPTIGGRAGWRCTTSGATTNINWAASTNYTVGTPANNGGNCYVAVLPPAWAANTAYNVGDVRSAHGMSYIVTTAGTSGTAAPIEPLTGIADGTVVWSYLFSATSASSGGPSGTGSNIQDGQVYWTYQPAFGFEEYGRTSLESFTVATVPSAAARPRQQIYVSNESGGATPAFSDGTNWRRVSDLAVIS